jgi:chemotaxis protein CheD
MSALAAPREDRWAQSGAKGDGWASFSYFERAVDLPGIKLLPGEFYVTGESMALTTVLGSCVSACIRDRDLGVGGMNHFMLPDTEGTSSSARYGSYAMEILVNELLKLGAARSRLEAKVFGGGAVLKNMTECNVGARNAAFVLDYLKAERIPVVSKDLGDTCPRKVLYVPGTGRAMVKHLTVSVVGRDVSDVEQAERAYRSKLVQQPAAGSVELF